jgi:Protein of unknown function (DUF429)
VIARAFLSGAASTVFSTPTREVLARPFGPGLGVSAQAHALGPRILHLTRLAESDTRIYEVHPEVSFRAMNGGRALTHRKKWAGGALERVELLRTVGIELGNLGAARERAARRRAGRRSGRLERRPNRERDRQEPPESARRGRRASSGYLVLSGSLDSTKRQRALVRRICSTVRQFASRSRGLATR